MKDIEVTRLAFIAFVKTFIFTMLVISFIQIGLAKDYTEAIEAGPIWDQADAETKCPAVAQENNGTWTGQWWTTVPGEMSVCQVKFITAAIEAGPIWDQADAETKCPVVAQENNGTWTGQWWTTVPGEMSVCQVTLNESTTEAIEAGPIWDQADAETKCPVVAQENNGTWTGQWWTTVPGEMSVCQLIINESPTVAIEAGPIWDQTDAETKCPAVAQENNGTWTGQWWTTVPGEMSVCQVTLSESTTEEIEVGPIWDQADAETKCPAVAEENNGTWTGQWSTTVPGEMSVCQIELN